MTVRKFSSAPLLIALAMIVLAVVVLTLGAPASRAIDHQKISARVLNETANGGSTEALIVLA